MSSPTIQTILQRRSIRKYLPEPLADAQIQQILDAAVYAPSAMNNQKWHFSVVRSQAMLDKIRQVMQDNLLHSGVEFLMERAAQPDFIAFHNAPVVVIISADDKSGSAGIDCGAAAQNLMLAAESMGVSSCIMTSSEFLFAGAAEALKKELGVPEGYRHVCAVTLGYRAGDTPPAPPRNKDVFTYI